MEIIPAIEVKLEATPKALEVQRPEYINPMQKSLSKSSFDIKSNRLFLKMMSRKYKQQVEDCESSSPLPIRSGNKTIKSSLNFSLPNRPLGQNAKSLIRLPNSGANLLPAIAMLPQEHS